MNLRPSRLALVCAAAFAASLGGVAAQAQTAAPASSVTLNGLIDVSVGRTQAPGRAAERGVDNGQMTTSWIGVRGNEDLGGGLRAVFSLESFLRADTGKAGRFDADALWARNAFVGVGGGFGTVTLGRITTDLFVQTLLFNAFGDSFGYSPSIRHQFISGTTTGDTAWSDSIKYATPAFGPLRGAVQFAANDGDGGRNWAASLGYGSGPVAASLAFQKVKKGIAVDDTTSWQAAASWDMQPVKFYGQFGKVDNDTTGNSWKLIDLGAAWSVTPTGKALLQFGQLRPDQGARRDTFSLGYDHWMSKRTDLYLVGMRDKISGVGSGTSYSAGMRHRF